LEATGNNRDWQTPRLTLTASAWRETIVWELAPGATQMSEEEWIKRLEDGRNVKFIYQELPEDGAFITAQIEGNEVVYSVVLTKAKNPLSREDVESHFKGELSKN
jgi:hypothetical protein